MFPIHGTFTSVTTIFSIRGAQKPYRISFLRMTTETGLRNLLTGHEGGNAGHRQGGSSGSSAPVLDPTRSAPPSRNFSADSKNDLVKAWGFFKPELWGIFTPAVTLCFIRPMTVPSSSVFHDFFFLVVLRIGV